MKKITTITTAIVALASIACGSNNMRYPDKTTKVNLTGKSVLIVAEDNAAGAAGAFGAAVAQKVGSIKILPGVPKDAVGISKMYAEFGLKNQGNVNTSDPKAIALETILKLAANLGKFDTIVFAGAEKASGFSAPMTAKLELYGAVYDMKTQKVTAAAYDTGTVVLAQAEAQMAIKGRGIADDLLNGLSEDKKEETK